MALLPILEAPHPILSKKARPVAESEFGSELVQIWIRFDLKLQAYHLPSFAQTLTMHKTKTARKSHGFPSKPTFLTS